MTRLGRTVWILSSLLIGLLACVYAVRVCGHFTGLRAETGRTRLIRLDDATRERLAALSDKVYVTYYVTARENMPSHLRRLEREVGGFLAALKEASRGRLDFQIVDPSGDEELQRFASRRKVAPLRERRVTRDTVSEQEVWSTLTIDYGPRRSAIVNGVSVDHLPRLQRIFVEHLNQLERPRRPVFALAAPAQGYASLRQVLAQHGDVVDVDLAAAAESEELPADADVLFWMEPRAVGARELRLLDRLVAEGRSVVVAGSRHAGSVSGGAAPSLALADTGFDPAPLLGRYGLAALEGVVLDDATLPQSAPETGGTEVAMPFLISSVATNMDFHATAADLAGTIQFLLPTAVALDTELLREQGWQPEILITSSDDTRLRELVPGTYTVADLADRTQGQPAPKLPLMVWLTHADPWRGSLLYCGASSMFRDDRLLAEGNAHERLVKVLCDTLASDERLVAAHAGIVRAEPLPELSAAARVLWRVLAVFLFPALLLGLAIARGTLRRDTTPLPATRATASWKLGAVARLAAGLVLVALCARFAAGSARFDLTTDRLNTASAVTRDLARRAVGPDAITAELYFSAPDRLPPAMRRHVRRLEDALRTVAAAGAQIDVTRVRPEDLPDAERAALEKEGIRPARITSVAEETTTVRTVYGALRLSAGDRVEVLSFTEPDAFENVEFRVAFALWRLQSGEHPHVAFASDVPRLSGAEAHQYYQSKGLVAPKGQDVYSTIRRLIGTYDFRVTHVNPRKPVLPAAGEIDALVWLQPRRNVKEMLEATVGYLYRGGKVFLAAQHFSVQSRQYRGTGFEFVYWPQPQSPDVEEFWFPWLGLRMVREVLFDAVNTHVELDSQVHASSRREFRRMELAKPFVIRGVAGNFAKDSPVTRWLGDLPLLFCNYFQLDAARLNELGLAVKTLITTSPDVWSLDWKGGWLPEELLGGPPAPDLPVLAETPQPEGPLPVFIEVDGQFPWPQESFVFESATVTEDGTLLDPPQEPVVPLPEPVGEGKPGKLLFLAESEMFKDRWLQELRERFRAEHLLLNAVAYLTLEPALAELMAKRPSVRGFDPVTPATKLEWRAIVALAGPAFVVLLGLLRAAWLRGTR